MRCSSLGLIDDLRTHTEEGEVRLDLFFNFLAPSSLFAASGSSKVRRNE